MLLDFAAMPGSLLIAGSEFARRLLWTMHSP